jgi:hypothetical protein
MVPLCPKVERTKSDVIVNINEKPEHLVKRIRFEI